MIYFRFVVVNTQRESETIIVIIIIIIIIKNNNMFYQIMSLDSSMKTKKGWIWIGHFGFGLR